MITIELDGEKAWFDEKEFAWSRYYTAYLTSRLCSGATTSVDREEYESVRNQFDSEWLNKIKNS